VEGDHAMAVLDDVILDRRRPASDGVLAVDEIVTRVVAIVDRLQRRARGVSLYGLDKAVAVVVRVVDVGIVERGGEPREVALGVVYIRVSRVGLQTIVGDGRIAVGDVLFGGRRSVAVRAVAVSGIRARLAGVGRICPSETAERY